MIHSPFANLRGTPPSPIIRFRHDLVPNSSRSIPTGYDTSWQAGRLENYSSNPLLRLPNELLLEIMERLPPPDLYVVRQVSHLFAALFCHHAFSKYHQKTTEIDPATAEPTVHRLLRAYRKIRGKMPFVPHFIPGIEFNLDALLPPERCHLRTTLQRRTFCSRCLAGGSQVRQAPTDFFPFYKLTRGNIDIACSACQCSHHPSWFSPAQRQRPHPVCIGWEGTMRICPHHSLSWSRLRNWIDTAPGSKGTAPVFRCRQCAAAFGRRGKAPEITYSPPQAWQPTGGLTLDWYAPVHALARGDIITKDLLRRSLVRFNQQHPGLLCPHLSFDMEQLMMVFYWHRCVCFRQPSALSRQYRKSDESDGSSCSCSAMVNIGNEDHVGSFPILPPYLGMPRHIMHCRQCLYHFKWTSDGKRIYLRGTLYSIGAASRILTDRNGTMNERRVSSCWLGTLDPSTYQQAEAWRHTKWCPDKRCANSTNRRNW